mmetsp:Transcript_4850/g.9953  ORF Transcript_4850/g.9953 Transcript_4850/m.9953 type:complete len:204 (+) Transcript_4850:239-850(+)
MNEPLPNFIRGRLTRPSHIPNNFRPRIMFSHRRIVLHILMSPIERPPHGMHPRIDDQSTCPQGLARKLTHPIRRILVQTQIFPESFAMEPPPFDIPRIKRESTRRFEVPSILGITTKVRKGLILHLNGSLGMMPRNRLVQRQRFAFVSSSRGQFRSIDEERPGSRTRRVRRSGQIIRRRGHGGTRRGSFHDGKRETREGFEMK